MGFQALKDIEASLATGYNKAQLTKLSSTFYTYIPHKIKVGRMNEFVLDLMLYLLYKILFRGLVFQISLFYNRYIICKGISFISCLKTL